MKHFSTPAWTFGENTPAEPKSTNKHSPPPDSYDVRPEEVKVNTFSMGKGPRGLLYKPPRNPGPGDYEYFHSLDERPSALNAKKKIKRNARTTPEKKDKSALENPGPGTYNFFPPPISERYPVPILAPLSFFGSSNRL